MSAAVRILAVLVLVVVTAACDASGSDADRVAELEQQVADLQEEANAPTTDMTVAPAPTSASQLNRAEENAIRSAESYLQFAAFSRSGLINQLEFEGFTNAEATLAVDSLGVDWNKQAMLSAESYLDYSAFSQSGLVEQLEFEGFTSAQATHGVNAITVDWNEQAWQSAESYLNYSSFSRSGLIDQLLYEGFTQSQAAYGVDKAGL